jgi:hypothetical protein
MMTQHQQSQTLLDVTSPLAAQELLVGAMSAIQTLKVVLEHETRLMKLGRVRQALELTEQKEAASKLYMITLERVKANMLALKRFASDRLVQLKKCHVEFQSILEENKMILVTTKAVTEDLIRSVAQETQSKKQLVGYNQGRSSVKSLANTGGFFVEKRA